MFINVEIYINIMSRAIIPEVIKTPIQRKINDKVNYNINISQEIDRRNYDIHQNFTTNNTSISNNTNSKGFFGFLFDLITLPVRLPYYLIKHIFTKYDLVNKFKLERIAIKKDNLKRKYLNKAKSIYDLDEIY